MAAIDTWNLLLAVQHNQIVLWRNIQTLTHPTLATAITAANPNLVE